MQIARIALVAAAAVLFPALAGAAELTGKDTFYWTYSPTNLGGDQSGAFSIGRATGPSVAADGTAVAVDCVSSTTPSGTAGGCIEYRGGADTFRIEFHCDQPLSPLPAGAIGGCLGTAKAVSGTGKFANISGTNTHTLVISGFMADGTLVGYTVADRHFTY